MDREATGVDRPAFLHAWLADTPTRKSLCVLRNGRLEGFGTIRRCRDGLKAGPLTATSATTALDLLAGLARVFPGEPLALDTPESNLEAIAVAGRLGLRPAFETARMYRGAPPVAEEALIWGVATLELG